MKTIKAVLALFCVLSQSLWAKDIDSSLSGSWFNPFQDGHGLSVEVITGGRTVIYWYVYNPDGTPTFLITVGDNDGNTTTGDTWVQSGMKFGEFDPNDVNREIWGTMTLSFEDCAEAQLDYQSNDPQFGSGSIPMTRLVAIDGLNCTESPVHGNYSISRAVWDEESGQVIVTTGTALLFANGDMTYMLGTETFGFGTSFNLVGLGSWNTTGEEMNPFEFSASTYSLSGGGPTPVSGSGFYDEDGFMTMDDGFTESMTATRLSSFQNPLSLEMLSGTYGIATTDVIIGEANIGADGSITGNMNDCTLDGTIEVPDHNFNQANFDLMIQDCDSSSRVAGSVLYDPTFNSITLLGENTERGFVWMLY